MNKKINDFVLEALKASSETLSNEKALKYTTTTDDFVDNFAAISHFKAPRTYGEVVKDMSLLWSQNPLLCLKLAVYIRLITRKTKLLSSDVLEVQKGQGLKNEGILRMYWIAINHPKTFKANIYYFISAGSWKDIFKMLSLDLNNGWDNRKLDWNFLYTVILAGLQNPETTHLVRKYLPTIRTNKKCKTKESVNNTIIGRWLASKFFACVDKYTAYRLYRQYKSEGVAHQWQQLISKQLYDSINFDKIAGRALALLVGSKFLENHNLDEKYSEWIKSKPVAKFTGYVFELFAPLNNGTHIEKYKEDTINAQFRQLIENDKNNPYSSLLVVRDTSGSMTAKAIGCNVSSFNIAKSMALYFSEFLTGEFAGTFAEFSDECVLHTWKGNTPVDKYLNDRCGDYAGTNFQSVIDMLISIKERGVAEKDFPSGILCISDGEFANRGTNTLTNFQLAIKRLRGAGFSEDYVNNFKIILWDIPNDFYGYHTEIKFEDFAEAPNFFYLSGYDSSVISFLLGNSKTAPKNAKELFLAAMDQSLLNMLKIV